MGYQKVLTINMKPYNLLLLLLACLLLVAAVSAETVVIYPIAQTMADTEITGTYAQLRGATTGLWSGDHPLQVRIRATSTTDQYDIMFRNIMIFNTSVIPGDATIDSAKLSFVAINALNGGMGTPSVVITGGRTAGNASVIDSDFYRFYDVEYADRILYSNIVHDETTRTNMSITNLSFIEKGTQPAFSKLFVRDSWDVDNTAPTWSSGGDSYLNFYRLSNADIALRPFLEVTYSTEAPPDTTPPLSITGLMNSTPTCSSMNWQWVDPVDADFEGVEIYRNGTWLHNVTTNYDNWTGLAASAAYTISTHTYDTTGNVNSTWVNATVSTTACTTPTPTPAPTPVTEDWEACFPWCGIQELFFWNESSDVSGYKILNHYPELSSQREVNVTISSATGSQQLGAWVSPSGTPGVTTIAPGFWRFRTFHNVSSQVGTTTLEFFIMNRSSTGVETNLFYNKVITEDINSLIPDEYLLSYARRNATTMFAGDRLLLKVNASTTSVTARKVYMWLAGNTNTSMVQASNFICCDDGSCSGGGSGISGIEWPLIVYGLVGGILGALVIIRRGKP